MKITLFICLLVVAGISCNQKSDYHQIVEKELAKGERYDSLFLGIFLGMEKEQFYQHCWELNKQQIITNGASNLSVRYDLKTLKKPAVMNFYPTFHEDKIIEMPVRISYLAWAPWNRELQSDSLQVDVLKWCENVYGKGFIEVKHPKHGSAFVKVDGNRRISIFREDERSVQVWFVDLLNANPAKSNS
jgi:hypothetical protein